MESENSASWETQAQVETTPSSEKNTLSNQWFTQQFDEILPKIQEEWPDIAKQTIETTRGSLDDLVQILSDHSGKTSDGVVEQLEDILNAASYRTKEIAESLGLPDEKGAFITNINQDGPSKKAGLQEGDVIIKFNDITIKPKE